MVCPTCGNCPTCGGHAGQVPVVDMKIVRTARRIRFGEAFTIPLPMDEDGARPSIIAFHAGRN